MSNTVQTIPLINLAYTFIPVTIVIGILVKWSLKASNAIYAIARMLVQLLIIGYFLVYIFEAQHAWIIILILTIMVIASSWIALGTIEDKRRLLFKHAFWSILLGGGITLALVSQAVLALDPWYQPQFMIPLAGMIFANSMNSISLAVERLNAELKRNVPYDEARNIAFHASLIPIINSLFAVGLVSLPGMMTGQILSGVSPLIAIRYQIMVMCMLFGASGITTACFLVWVKPFFENNQNN